MRTETLGILLAVGFALTTTSAARAANVDIDLILDVSGSMNKMDGNKPQIQSAREALSAAIATIPEGAHVGLRVYGHRVGQADKAGSCKDTELVVPLGPPNTALIQEKANALTPLGYTPIAYSLEQSKADFDLTREAKKSIILLSDGEETCGGDPVAVITQMRAAGFDVVVHTIGINADSVTLKQLQEIATAGGGKYFDARGVDGLKQSIASATQDVLRVQVVQDVPQAQVIEKEKAGYGELTRGGDSYETAVPLPLDVELKLDHEQLSGFYDYFYIDLGPGQVLKGVAKTLETNPAAFEIHDDGRNKLKRIDVGNRNSTDQIELGRPGRLYILVGSRYGKLGADGTYQFSILEGKGDLGGGQDAGDTPSQALSITPGQYPTNYIACGDELDVFAFEAKAGDQIDFTLLPDERFTRLWLSAKIQDDLRQRIVSKSAANRGAGLRIGFTAKTAGTYHLIVDTDSYDACDELGVPSYSVSFKREAPSVEETEPATPKAKKAESSGREAKTKTSAEETKKENSGWFGCSIENILL